MTDLVYFVLGVTLLVTTLAIGYEAGQATATRRINRARRMAATAIRIEARR